MPVAPSGLLTLGCVSQGKPWAKLSWPVGPKTRPYSARAHGKCLNFSPGTSCLATIRLSLRDEYILRAEELNEFAVMGFRPWAESCSPSLPFLPPGSINKIDVNTIPNRTGTDDRCFHFLQKLGSLDVPGEEILQVVQCDIRFA